MKLTIQNPNVMPKFSMRGAIPLHPHMPSYLTKAPPYFSIMSIYQVILNSGGNVKC
jgi:hypothetical protein